MEMCEVIHNAQPPIHNKWFPPAGWTMCNTDVVIGETFSVGAAVFRNEKGVVLNISTKKLQYSEPLAGEVAAINWGAEVAVSLNYNNVIFQSDSKGTIEAITTDHSMIKDLNHNIQPLVQRFHTIAHRMELWEATWVPRSLNGVADFVAHLAIQSGQFGTIELTNFVSSLPTLEANGNP
uniref:RNase H type-1 domain-containing protein n=1 Tax=Cannabis sativa TaxID=3483 RepID=A0A803QIZ3_CANSA